jgi:hypothetical protein
MFVCQPGSGEKHEKEEKVKERQSILTNEFPLGQDTGRQAAGEICLANEERFTATHFSEPLTAYAMGWVDPENILATLDAIAPPVSVGRRFEYKSAVNAEAFLSETDDIRAIGSPFKRVEYKGTSVNESTKNKGLTLRLDRDDMQPGDEEAAVRRLLQRIRRNDLRRAVTLIVAAANNTAKTWDTTAGKDPDSDVLGQVIVSGNKRGIDANIVVFGQAAWQKRVLSLRAQTHAGGFANSAMTPDALAGWLGVDRVVLCRARYQSAAATKSAILGSYVLMYFAQANIGKDDPSNAKRFWTPTESGRERVYMQEHAKFIDITVEHYSNIVVDSTGVEMFTVS